jgi:hypothetical protein
MRNLLKQVAVSAGQARLRLKSAGWYAKPAEAGCGAGGAGTPAVETRRLICETC